MSLTNKAFHNSFFFIFFLLSTPHQQLVYVCLFVCMYVYPVQTRQGLGKTGGKSAEKKWMALTRGHLGQMTGTGHTGKTSTRYIHTLWARRRSKASGTEYKMSGSWCVATTTLARHMDENQDTNQIESTLGRLESRAARTTIPITSMSGHPVL